MMKASSVTEIREMWETYEERIAKFYDELDGLLTKPLTRNLLEALQRKMREGKFYKQHRIKISDNYIRSASEYGVCERCLDYTYIGRLYQGRRLCERDRAYAVSQWGEL